MLISMCVSQYVRIAPSRKVLRNITKLSEYVAQLSIHFQPSPFEHEASAQQINSKENASFVDKCLMHRVDSPGGAYAAPLQLHIKLHSEPSNEGEFPNVAESNAKTDAKTKMTHANASGNNGIVARKDANVAQKSSSCQLQVVSTAHSQNDVGMLELEDDNDNISAFERLKRLGSDKYSDSSRTATDPDLPNYSGEVQVRDISSTSSTTSDTPLAGNDAVDADAETEIDWSVQPALQQPGEHISGLLN